MVLKKLGTTTLSIERVATDTHSEATLDIALTITKAEQTITGLTELINLTVGNTMDFTIGGNGDGALTDNSEHSAIVTTSLTGNTLTLTAVAVGDASITLNKAATDNYNLITNRYAVVVTESKMDQTIDLANTLNLPFQDSNHTINFDSTGTGAFSVTSSAADVATADVTNNGSNFTLNINP